MPDRVIRSGILTSDAVNKLGWGSEVFYRRLMNIVDDYGRYDGRSSILRATLYPLKLNQVSDTDIGKWKQECAKAGLVSIYEVEKKEYVEIYKFDQRLRAAKSKWPEPNGSYSVAVNCQQESADVDKCYGDGIGDGDVKPPNPLRGLSKVILQRYPDGDFIHLTDRLWSLFHRKPDTLWHEKELKSLEKAPLIDEEGLEIMEWLFTESGYEYLRKDLVTLLNNWNTELDRARSMMKGRKNAKA